MAKIGSGTISVGSAAGANNSINGIDGIGNVQTNITTRESTFMGGNPANLVAAGAKCMPNQAQKTINLANLTGSAYIYSGTPAGNAWKQTAMSEFKGAYTTRPSVSQSTAFAGVAGYGNCTLTCVSPSDVGGICAVYVTPTPSGGTVGWVSCNGSNQYTFKAATNQPYTVYVKDFNNCGANLEVFISGIFYTG